MKKLTEVAQDGTNKGRLDDTELAFHEREDLQNWLSRWTGTQHALRTATISSTLCEDIKAIKSQPESALVEKLTCYPANKGEIL